MTVRADEPMPPGTGVGPGAFTADGNSVELYARLPAGREPDVIAGAVPAGSLVLELGAGAGRLTHVLVERGYRVVAVDECQAMLDRVRGARTVCSRIEDLHLTESFEAVVLASFLVNTTEPDVCAQLPSSRRLPGLHRGRIHHRPDPPRRRRLDPWLTSGSCATAPTKATARIFTHHPERP